MSTWKPSLQTCLTITLITLLTSSALAQHGLVKNYTVTTFTGTFINATSGTYLGSSDDGFYKFSSPFDIIFDSTTYPANSTMYCTDDGNFGLANLTSNPYYSNWVGNPSFPGALCVYNQDLIHIVAGGNYWTVVGSAPNRTLVIEQYNTSPFYNSSQVTSLEVLIHETSGVIEYLYANHGIAFGGAAHIGMNGLTNVSTDYYSYSSNTNGVTPSSDIRFTPHLDRPPSEFSLLPKSLNFGSLLGGQQDTLCVTASDVGAVGSAALHITGYGITGSSAYSIVSGPAVGDSLVPGSSVEFCIQFQPLSGGTSAGIFSVSTDAHDSATQTVSLTGFGRVPLVSYGTTSLFRHVHTELRDTSPPQYIPVTNIGGAPLQFNSIYFIGLNPDSYFVSYMPQNPLPPDATDSIGIRFAPSIEGRPDAEVVINTNAQNLPFDTVQLLGIGMLPHLVITVPAPGSGNTIMFDSVALGDSVCQTITLTNTGTDTLEILKQLVTYGDYDFTFYPLMGSDTIILPGGGSQLVNVCFKPLKVGTRLANIRFYTSIPLTFEKPPRDTSQFVLNVTGVGVPYGQLAIMGPLEDTAVVGKSHCITDTLINRGQTDLTVTAAKLSPTTGNFTISGVTFPLTLAAGQMKIFTLCFDPAKRGLEGDTLTFTGVTSEKSITQPVFLQGLGVINCVTVDTMVTFGANALTMVGFTDTACITVSNCGDLAATYTVGTLVGSNFTLLPPFTSMAVAPGDTTQFCVAFTPAALGADTGTVLVSGGPSPQSVVLSGMGAGVIASATGVPSRAVTLGMCDTYSVFVRNTGNVAWTPGAAHISGADSADFTVQSGPMPSVIPPGGTATVVINFCPKVNGPEPMMLVFPAAAPMPITAFSYNVTAMGTTEGVTMRTEENGFSLGQSYPNPTNGTAEIAVTMPYDAPVRIDIVDATGSLVRDAFTGRLVEGKQLVSLDAKCLPSGTYFYTLTSGDIRLTRQLSLIK